jgi:hypothetical protein
MPPKRLPYALQMDLLQMKRQDWLMIHYSKSNIEIRQSLKNTIRKGKVLVLFSGIRSHPRVQLVLYVETSQYTVQTACCKDHHPPLLRVQPQFPQAGGYRRIHNVE